MVHRGSYSLYLSCAELIYIQDPEEVLELFGGQWKTADFQPGDLLTFVSSYMHKCIVNR